MDSAVLLQAVAGVARAVQSLYGPNKLRKQVTDHLDQTLFTADADTLASTLQSQNAGTAILQQALHEQRKVFGTGCTTIVTLCGVLAEATLELQRQGLPTDIIQHALSTVETCCLQTVKHMRVPLSEAFPSFHKLSWPRQVATLGQTLSKGNDTSMATPLAVKVATCLDPIRFCGDEDISLRDLVTTHVVLGGVTSATSSRVLNGVLLPIATTSQRDTLRRRFSSTIDSTISMDGGVAILAGDLETTNFTAELSVQIIFVHGDISEQVTDASVSSPNAPLCIPVSCYDSLRQLAEMSGAEIVDSWEELLPNAIGRECLHVKTLDLSVSRTQDGDDDGFATFFLQTVLPDVKCQPNVSVIVQGPTKSLAVELRNETRKMICRLRNALHSGYVLPGNGGFWCACAAAIAQEGQLLAKSNLELLSFATSRLTDPLLQLGVILLENSAGCGSNGVENDSFFSRMAQVRAVQSRFARSVQDVGASKFYSRYYDIRSSEYMVLSSKRSEPESEDDQLFHADEYKSMSFAIRGAFRVIQLLLTIDRHHVN